MKNALFAAAASAMCLTGHRALSTQEKLQIVALTNGVMVDDPEFCVNLIKYARNTVGARELAILMAVEAIKSGKLPETEPLMHSILLGLNDPKDFVARWNRRRGGDLPEEVKQAISHAMERIVLQHIVKHYDGSIIDLDAVIGLCDPTRETQWQRDFIATIKKRRLGRISPEVGNRLTYRTTPRSRRRNLVGEKMMSDAGVTWEWVVKWLGSTDAELWSLMIPTMEYVDVVDNLWEFDRAGIGPYDRVLVKSIITDGEQIARWGITPYRILDAVIGPSARLQWLPALDGAMTLAAGMMPPLEGTTTILLPPVAPARTRAFAAAVALRNEGRIILARGRPGGGVHPVTEGRSVMEISRAIQITPGGRPQDPGSPSRTILLGGRGIPDAIPDVRRGYVIDWTAEPGRVRLIGNTAHISGTPGKLFEVLAFLERYDWNERKFI